MTEKSNVVRKLRKLCQLDIDAIHAYDQAIPQIDHEEIRHKITSFRGDHERHVTDLTRMIRDLGGDPPEFSRDFKGFIIEGFTKIRSATGTEGALKAMRGNEKLTNRTYEGVLKDENLPPDVRDLVGRGLDDERRHLSYIENTLESKPWRTDETIRKAG